MVAVLRQYVLQLFAQHQRIQVRHAELIRLLAIGLAAIHVDDMDVEQRHGGLLALVTRRIEVGVLGRPAGHYVLVVHHFRAIVARRAGAQLDFHVGLGAVAVLERDLRVRCGAGRAGVLLLRVFAQKQQIVEAGLARVAQPAPQIHVAGDAPRVRRAGVWRRAGVQRVVRFLVAALQRGRLDRRVIRRYGIFNLVQFLGHRCGGILDAAQAALDDFVGFFAG